MRVSVMSDLDLTEAVDAIEKDSSDPRVPELCHGVLVDFCFRQLFGVPQSTVTMNWLQEAFDKLLSHEPAGSVFPLPKRSAHRPKDSTRATEVAWWMHWAVARGYTVAEAKGLAADMFSVELKSVERYRRQAAQWVAGMNLSSDWEDYFIGEGKPLPAAKNETLNAAKDIKSRVPVPTRKR
jgi:hypothetical protein